MVRWAYAVTTVPSRRGTHLPRTLQSLRAAGFDAPKLFIDGCSASEALSYEQEWGLTVVPRYPRIRTAFHWILTLAELWLRNGEADRFAIFQDDLIACKNLRAYLDRCAFPHDGYWNLYTFPENQSLCPAGYAGWYPSNQQGRGAVGLVFDRAGVQDVLTSWPHIWDRAEPDNLVKDGWRKIDGGVVEALGKKKRQEYTHSPSLLQHTGEVSTTQNGVMRPDWWAALSFPGEGYDALELLERQEENAKAWHRELEALERAITDDEERLARSTDRIERRKYSTMIERYKQKLAAHRASSYAPATK